MLYVIHVHHNIIYKLYYIHIIIHLYAYYYLYYTAASGVCLDAEFSVYTNGRVICSHTQFDFRLDVL